VNRAQITAIIFLILFVGTFGSTAYSYHFEAGVSTTREINSGTAIDVYQADYPWNVVYQHLPKGTALTGDQRFIVIDLSDTTNYPHSETDHVILKEIIYTACLDANTGSWEITFGTVTRIDATNGDVTWYNGSKITNKGCYAMPKLQQYPYYGLDLTQSGTTLTYVNSGYKDTNSVQWQTDVNLTTFLGGSAAPGDGDLVIFFDEESDGAGLYFTAQLIYRTE